MANDESRSTDSSRLEPTNWAHPISVSDSDLPSSVVSPKAKKRSKGKSKASSSSGSGGKKKKKSPSKKGSSSQSTAAASSSSSPSSSSSKSSSSSSSDDTSTMKKKKTPSSKKAKKKKGKKKDSLGSMKIGGISPMIRSQTEVSHTVIYDDTLPPMPEMLPAFLDCDGGSSKPGSTRVAGGERDFYQRKKDVKLLNLKRECDETEKKFCEKWSKSYGKSLEDIELDWCGMDIQTCINMLLTMDEEWQNRMLIVQTLVHQLCQAEVSEEVYCLKMCKFLTAVARQFVDARSLVIEDMHRHLARLARLTSERFVFFAPYIYSHIIVIFGIRIEVMRESVVNLGEAIINACLIPDMSEENPNKNELLRGIIDGLDYKSADGRMQSARFLVMFLNEMSPFFREFPLGSAASMVVSAASLHVEDAKEEASDVDDDGDGGDPAYEGDSEVYDFIEFLDDAVRKAVNGSSTEIRNQGYVCLKRWEILAPKHAQLIIERMSKAVLRKYKKVKNQRRTSLY